MPDSADQSQASVDRVRQEVERWIDVARTAGERTLEAIGLTPGQRSSGPAMDVLETTESFHVWVDVPGLTVDAVQLAATDTQLTLKIARTAAAENVPGYLLRERPQGSLERTITLPVAIRTEATTAQLRDGVLFITLTKQQAAQPRTVPVTVG